MKRHDKKNVQKDDIVAVEKRFSMMVNFSTFFQIFSDMIQEKLEKI